MNAPAGTDLDSGPHRSAAVNILVVDDVEDSLLATRSLLARPGLTVLTASSATQALEMLAEHDVALALLDVHMPHISGFELAERMRCNPRTRGVPIIFVTGNDPDPSRTFQGYEAGAVDFLIKPVDPRVLESKVSIFMELYRQRRELSERNGELERLLQINEMMAEELRKAHGKAMVEANTDALTGVSNRRHIFQMGNAILADRRQQAQLPSVAMLDLDHFKAINDEYGHDMGDAVLRAFCEHIVKNVRPSHALGRIGGEEFLLIMPGTALGEAEVILERLHRSLRPCAGISYSFSAGLAQACSGEDLEAVIKRADDALFSAKRGGRDCSVTSPAPL
jgi:two-component system, cell cycle response regulator